MFVLEGEVVLKTNAGEQVLKAGMCAGFRAGVEDGHQFINRSARPAVYLEISNRDAGDLAHYPDDDMAWSGPAAHGRIIHKDGRAY